MIEVISVQRVLNKQKSIKSINHNINNLNVL